VMGFSAALLIYTLSALNMAAYRSADDPRQPWLPEPGPGQISLLVETIQEVSVYQTGREDSVPITLMVDNPSVLWALRDFKNLSFDPEGSQLLSADVVITGQERADRMQALEYLGQDFLQILDSWVPLGSKRYYHWDRNRQSFLILLPHLLRCG